EFRVSGFELNSKRETRNPRLSVILRNDVRKAMLRGVRNRKRPSADTQFCRKPCGLLMKHDIRFAASGAPHFDVEPGHPGAPSPPPAFIARFLGRKGPGVVFFLPALFFFKILIFFFGKARAGEAPADTTVLERPSNALDFNHVDANAYDHKQ